MSEHTPSHSVISVGFRFGLLLGAAHVINHSLEVFAGLSGSLSAARGVAMWGVIFVVCSAASSWLVARTGSVPLGAVASAGAGLCGALILVAYAIGVGAATGDPLAVKTIATTGGMHVGGSMIVGAMVGLVSGGVTLALARASRTTAWGVVVGHLILLVAGLMAIAHATGLERSARPPFIMLGLPAVALALAVAAPAVMTLTHTRR